MRGEEQSARMSSRIDDDGTSSEDSDGSILNLRPQGMIIGGRNTGRDGVPEELTVPEMSCVGRTEFLALLQCKSPYKTEERKRKLEEDDNGDVNGKKLKVLAAYQDKLQSLPTNAVIDPTCFENLKQFTREVLFQHTKFVLGKVTFTLF